MEKVIRTLMLNCNISSRILLYSRTMNAALTRREFVKSMVAVPGLLALGEVNMPTDESVVKKPNVLFIMCDQLRADAIAALGNPHTYTPNFDRLVRRGISFTHAYSTCPVCVPARYTIRTGCEPPTTGSFSNGLPNLVEGQLEGMEERCGNYLARTMSELGYRTFGIGKFHAQPWNADLGFETQIISEELFSSEQRMGDAYASFIAKNHPEYDWIEQLHGERTEMYYMPQMSPFPAELTVEGWAADRAVEQLRKGDNRPYFGFVSFIGPHPPLAPPIPFNRMYDPDRMPNPIRGDIAIDHMDEQIPCMNYAIWAEDINDLHARVLKARYYGEVSYIDQCLGRILDAVEARPDADNTLICFFSDHGDHLGDHHAWQKESFFEASCRVPFLLSWPQKLHKDAQSDELVCLTDLFGIATSTGNQKDLREGCDLLGILDGSVQGRGHIIGYYGIPGKPSFKVMARDNDWKYIFIANGNREQLFNVTEDPNELHQRITDFPDIAACMRHEAIKALSIPNADRALDGNDLRSFPYTKWSPNRIYQFDRSRGITGFPKNPEDVLKKQADG